jgi:AbrB family looped-hinge helix DNA binding protein
MAMAIARSRITSQGQISVPTAVRRKLGLAPGSVIEWDEERGGIVVRRAGGHTFDDIHRRLFPEGPPVSPVTVGQMDAGIRTYMRKKHARR